MGGDATTHRLQFRSVPGILSITCVKLLVCGIIDLKCVPRLVADYYDPKGNIKLPLCLSLNERVEKCRTQT